MWSFLSDITRSVSNTYTVVVFEDDSTANSREYAVRPRRLRWVSIGVLLSTVLITASVAVFTPLPELVRGYDVDALRKSARMHAVRVAALQDSLALQRRYVQNVSALLTGQVDSTTEAFLQAQNVAAADGDEDGLEGGGGSSVHEQPAMPLGQVPFAPERASGGGVPMRAGPPWPVMPPIDGFVTRGFDVETSHYAVDIAVEKGTDVQAVADGYVIFADWTQEGGYAVAVQHHGGYLSVYKHNQRLLKQAGDRVDRGEPIAVSGNTGHVTTGPHLHFELWQNGLAQDPRQFIIGW